MIPPLTFQESVELRVASADQRHTVDRIAAFATPGRVPRPVPSDWFRTVGLRLMMGLADGKTRLCPHLGPGRAFGPMYCMLRGQPEIQCRDCITADPPRLEPLEDLTCDRCSVYARGLVSGAVPIGPLLLLFGLCRSCAVELGAVREEAPAS